MMKSNRMYIVHWIFRKLPSTRCFKLKRALMRWAGAHIEENVKISSGAQFYTTGELHIGADSWIGNEVLVIGGNAAIKIGAKVDIGPRTTIVSGSHKKYTMPDRAAGEGFSSPINIGDGTWIGACSTILGGSDIGKRCIIGACSLVRGQLNENEMYAGNPAKPIPSASAKIQ